MSQDREYTVTLHPSQQRYLERVIEKYDLPDTGKAIRCLINHAIEAAEADDTTDESIFAEVRCYDC